MLHPTVYNVSQVCHQLGVENAVLSPGSRNAPLTVSFSRHPKIKKWVIPDERAAGFIALGIAQQTKKPVVLCCTSGTALLNYAPAVAEAFYREIPLIVISADRPPHLIDQRDGQTIRQFEALKNHVKASFQLPILQTNKDSEEFNSQLVKSIQLSQELPKSPVHLNIPFDEPFYPTNEQKLDFKTIFIPEITAKKTASLATELPHYSKVLILIGQNDVDEKLNENLQKLSDKIPIIQVPLNNLNVDGIEHIDGFIRNQDALQPELLITAGLSVLSKNLKIYLRKFTPKKHLHFDKAGIEVDTYQSNPVLIQQQLADFLDNHSFEETDSNYLNEWKKYSQTTHSVISHFFKKETTFSETTAFDKVNKSLPEHCILHLSNSMPVRFVDLLGVKKPIQTYSNRGTSGIDGCTSTAMGTALVSGKMNVLITGDLSFLYDRNAFFHPYIPNNFRVIVFNNQGGGIFRLIKGPSALPELEQYFETRHNRTAEYICKENELDYFPIKNFEELSSAIAHFYEPSANAKVMEIFTEPTTNEEIYNALKTEIYEHIERMENH